MGKKTLHILSDAAEQNTTPGNGTVSRRNFLKILGATSAATAVGCADSAKQNIYSYVKGDDSQNPGVAVWYSSTCSECSTGCGIRVRTREGRAVKIEGNPEHPVNQGGLCAIGQASLQHLYDPDRVRQPLVKNAAGQFEPASWSDALGRVKKGLQESQNGSALLTEELSGSLQKLAEAFGRETGSNVVAFEPLAPVGLARATEEVFGEYGVPVYSFDRADVIVSFGADFLETWISPVEFARGWARGKKRKYPAKFIQVEPRLSLTGSNADLWLNAKPGTEIHVALAVLKKLLQRGKANAVQPELRTRLFGLVEDVSIDAAAKRSGLSKEKILVLAETLLESRQSLVIAGGAASANNAGVALAVVTHYINALLGNVGKTVHPTVLQKPSTSLEKVKELVASLEAEQPLDVVLVHGTNPVFTLPSASRFKYALKRAGLIVSLSSHLDETAQLADVILPTHTGLESWGDTAGRPGVHGLRQPVMQPVFETREFGDLLIELGGAEKVSDGAADFKTYLQEQWKTIYQQASKKPASFHRFWLESLERGGYFSDYDLERADAAYVQVATLDDSMKKVRFATRGASKKGPVLLPYPSVKSFDGRAANRPWLQELPDPVTKAVWGSWVEMHPKTAKKYGVKQGSQVQLSTHYGEVNAPAYVTEHISEDVVAVPIGEGHTSYGRFASEGGGNVLQLLPDQLKEAAHGIELLSTRVAVRKGPGKGNLVLTQETTDQMDRHLSQTKVVDTSEHHDEHHDDHHGHHEEIEHFYDQRPHPLYKWGMAVDLAACTGCSACVVACYAENNIPTVGKEVCDQGREMSWLRIERYLDGSAEELQVNFLPMMCQHCNNAPCEPVCPVYATYHTEEGLNAMVYNRCVGTRYCGNNCSYKVRRYNWFEFDWPEPMNWQLNPDVTKRAAGVMEKCTFCVQRINEGKDKAKDEGRLVRDGEIKPACVQSCPTEALVFGNLNDPKSRVSKLAKDKRAYKVLDHHLNTQPSISYLQNIKHKV